MRDFLHNHGGEIGKSVFALGVNAIAIITSAQEQAEWALRCLSLLGGLFVAILTGFSIVRGWRKK